MAEKLKDKKSILATEIAIGKINLNQKALFAKNMATMLKAGLSLPEALSISQDSAKGKLKKILAKVFHSVKAGNSLSASLSRYPRVFSGFFINTIHVGETSGTLVENLENIAEQLTKEKILIDKIKGAMLYPIVILVATFILGLVLSFLVLPQITPLFEGLKIELPLSTQFLIWFSHLIEDYGFYLFGGIIFSILFIIWFLKRKFMRPINHYVLLKIPVVRGVIRNVILARFSITLAMLLKSGVNIDEALEITRDSIGHYQYQEALTKISQAVRKGSKLSENLNKFEHLFPIMLIRMVRVGEESGKFEENLFYLADFYEAEVDEVTKSLPTIIEPILLIFIGTIVLFLFLSIITPIYEITGNINR